MKKTFFLLLLIIPFFIACSDDDEPLFDMNSREWIYESDEIVYLLSTYSNDLAVLTEIKYEGDVAYYKKVIYSYIYKYPNLKLKPQYIDDYDITGYIENEKLHLIINSKELAFVLA